MKNHMLLQLLINYYMANHPTIAEGKYGHHL